jgi:hypothetical protein
MTSFLERNASTLVRSCSSEAVNFSCSDSSSATCLSSDCTADDQLLALQRRASEVVPAGRHRFARLAVELVSLLVQRRLLQLQPFLGGDDVGDSLLDVLELLDLALVGVVERLTRILGPVEQLRDLGFDVGPFPGDQSRH